MCATAGPLSSFVRKVLAEAADKRASNETRRLSARGAGRGRAGAHEEILSYHRDEDYKIVRLLRRANFSHALCFHDASPREVLDGCESYGRAPGVSGAAEYDPRHRVRSRGRKRGSQKAV